MRSLRLTALVFAVVAASSFFSGSAEASDCHPPQYYYKTLIVYETVKQPVVNYVVRYDHCGIAYRDKVVTYKHVQVAVEKRVKVYY